MGMKKNGNEQSDGAAISRFQVEGHNDGSIHTISALEMDNQDGSQTPTQEFVTKYVDPHNRLDETSQFHGQRDR